MSRRSLIVMVGIPLLVGTSATNSVFELIDKRGGDTAEISENAPHAAGMAGPRPALGGAYGKRFDRRHSHAERSPMPIPASTEAEAKIHRSRIPDSRGW